jgi:ribosomal protein S18 acetylase RimI-like enzyme
MSLLLPEGLTLRRATGADAEIIARIVAADERAIRGHADVEPAVAADWLRLAELKGEAWLVEDPGGEPSAFALVLVDAALADAWVNADAPVYGSLVELTERVARDRGATTMRQGAYAEAAARRADLEDRGYRVVRHFWRMQIVLDGPPREPEWPAGAEVSTLTRADARAFYDAIQEAFADEWGSHPMPFDEWVRFRFEAPDADLTLWFLVRDGGEVAAVLRGDANRFGGGWIGMLGVRKPWRRRGIGRALLQHAFCEFYRRGERRVSLGVDAENAAGATRLYERAGMHVRHEDLVYEKELD